MRLCISRKYFDGQYFAKLNVICKYRGLFFQTVMYLFEHLFKVEFFLFSESVEDFANKQFDDETLVLENKKEIDEKNENESLNGICYPEDDSDENTNDYDNNERGYFFITI